MKFLVEKLVQDKVINKMGKGNITGYFISGQFDIKDNPVAKVEAHLVNKYSG